MANKVTISKKIGEDLVVVIENESANVKQAVKEAIEALDSMQPKLVRKSK